LRAIFVFLSILLVVSGRAFG